MSLLEAFLSGFVSGFLSGAGVVVLGLWLVRRSERYWIDWVSGRRR